jgi:WXG100 family type VII secretion target
MAQPRTIKVTTQELRGASQQLTELAREYEGLYREVLSNIGDLNAVWEDKDSAKFRERVEGFRVEFEKMKREIDTYAEFLVKTAGDYESTQDAALAQASSLTSGGMR